MVRPDIVPHSLAQTQFIFDSREYLAYFAGFGGGKTWAGATKAYLNTTQWLRGRNGLMIAPNFTDLETICIPELITRFEDQGYPCNYRPSKKYIMIKLKIKGVWENIYIYLRSGEHPESIAGFNVGWVWIDEACRIPEGKTPSKDVKTNCIGRMRHPNDPRKQLFLTSTHEGELTWPYKDWIETPKANHVFYRGSTWDNPVMQGFAKGLEEQYDKKLVKQYVDGHAVTLAGVLVYYAFDDLPFPQGNIDDSIKIDPCRPVALSMDFNASPGMHAVVGQYFDELDEIRIVDEIATVGMNIPWLIKEYADRYKSVANLTMVYGDASGHSRDVSVGETCYSWIARCMNDQGISYMDMSSRCLPLVADRHISMNSAFEDGNGRHVKIHPRCTKLIRDLKVVQRDEAGRVDKSQERKGYVHISDAASYWVHSIRPIFRLNIEDLVTRKSG